MAAIFLGISLSSQDVAKTPIAGLHLMVVHPFKAGDHITVGPTAGRVESFHFRTTKFGTEDSQEVIVPNGIILSDLVAKGERSTCQAPDDPDKPC